MSLRHDSAPRHNPLRSSVRPVDSAVLAAARGKVIPALCAMSRPERPARPTTGARGFMRHGHTPHVRRCA
jgi:hypothetical protein